MENEEQDVFPQWAVGLDWTEMATVVEAERIQVNDGNVDVDDVDVNDVDVCSI